MDQLPALDLLESTHQFPCPYLFKIIGTTENGFVARAVAAVREELACPVDPPFQTRVTPGGRYIAVSVQPQVQSAQQVLAVYRRLKVLAGLVVLW